MEMSLKSIGFLQRQAPATAQMPRCSRSRVIGVQPAGSVSRELLIRQGEIGEFRKMGNDRTVWPAETVFHAASSRAGGARR